MLYSHRGKSFKHHVHPNLQRRMRIFLLIGGIAIAEVLFDIYKGSISIPFALLAIVVGGFVGYFTSRIFHLSWSHDGARVVGRIDTIGWFVLGAYLIFEVVRATVFEK